jgi:hypothetical protein
MDKKTKTKRNDGNSPTYWNHLFDEFKQRAKNGSKCEKYKEPWEILHEIKQSQICANQLPVHPEAYSLLKHKWEVMITTRFEAAPFSQEGGASERENLIRLLMDFLRRKWGLRKGDIFWVASVEYGLSGTAHAHIIFNFWSLKKSGKPIPDLAHIEEDLAQAKEFLLGTDHCTRHKLAKSAIGIHWVPKFDDGGLVRYICKKEPGREEKEFIWPRGDEWIEDFLEEVSA